MKKPVKRIERIERMQWDLSLHLLLHLLAPLPLPRIERIERMREEAQALTPGPAPVATGEGWRASGGVRVMGAKLMKDYT
jgi:hypothetical protein